MSLEFALVRSCVTEWHIASLRCVPESDLNMKSKLVDRMIKQSGAIVSKYLRGQRVFRFWSRGEAAIVSEEAAIFRHGLEVSIPPSP